LWAVVGLGNPGRRYAGTRHNAGFAFIHRLARRWKVKLGETKLSARLAEVRRNDLNLLLAQPQTYMNLSGAAVKQIMDRYGMEPENLILVYDDLDLPLGEIRVRKKGSAGTHKGVRSIIAATGTTSFPRIRIGIGPLPPGEDAAGYVLAPFSRAERLALEKSFESAEAALALILEGSIETAMNRFNKKSMIEV